MRPLKFNLFIYLLLTAPAARAEEIKGTCPLGREYYLYLPEKIDPDRTYWLVAGIHGRNGNGKNAGDLSELSKNGRCIVVGPSFPKAHKVLENQSDTQLIGLFKALAEKYKLHPKMFVTGFSAGGQFSQRFVFKYPDLVIGCAPHSSGTWMTGDDGGGVKFDDAIAGRIPFAISCGESDTGTATRDEFTPEILKRRIDWAREFEALLKAKRFYFKAEYYPGVAHKISPGAKALTQECFDLSVTGLHAQELKDVNALFAPVEDLIAAAKFTDAKARIEKLPAAYAELQAKQDAAKTQPASEIAGWHGNDSMRAELRGRTEAYVKEKTAELNAKLQRAPK